MVLPLYAALERMDWSLVEAAQDLGDSSFRAFRRVTLPLALPGVVAGSLLVFIPVTGEYLIPAILGGDKTAYAGNLIAQQFLEARDWPFGAAIAMVVSAAMTIALLVVSRGPSASRSNTVGRPFSAGYAVARLRLPLPADRRRRGAARSTAAGRCSFWDGFSTRWFGEALRDPTITEPLRTSLEIAVVNASGRLRPRDDARPRAATHAAAGCASRSTRSPT